MIIEKFKGRCLQAQLNLACQWALGSLPFPSSQGCCCFPCRVGSPLVAGTFTSTSQAIPTEREPEYPGQDVEVGRVPLGVGSGTDCTKCSLATPPATLNASELDLSIEETIHSPSSLALTVNLAQPKITWKESQLSNWLYQVVLRPCLCGTVWLIFYWLLLFLLTWF